MKKIIYIILSFFVLSSLLLSQSITVTDPFNGAVWQRTVRHNISWNVRGEMSNKVKIRLLNWRGTTKIKDIVNNTDNDGAYRCPLNIFNDVPDGEYKIRIKTIDDRFSGESNIFSIANPPTDETNTPDPVTIPKTQIPLSELQKRQKINPASLKRNMNNLPRSVIITHPPKDHIWDLRLGDKLLPFPIYIMWKKIGDWGQNSRVSIALMRVRIPATMNLVNDTANNGLFRGEIKRMDYGNRLLNPYTIVIMSSDGKIRVESERFYIKNDVYRLD